MEKPTRKSVKSLTWRALDEKAEKGKTLTLEEVRGYAYMLGVAINNKENSIRKISDSAAAVQVVAAQDEKSKGQQVAAAALSGAFAKDSLGFAGELDRLKNEKDELLRKASSGDPDEAPFKPETWVELFDKFQKARKAYESALSRSGFNLNKVVAPLPSPPAPKAEDEAESVPASATPSRRRKAGKRKGKGKQGNTPAPAVSAKQFEEAKRGQKFLAVISARQNDLAFLARRKEFIPAPEASKEQMEKELKELEAALRKAAKDFTMSECGMTYLSARFAMLGNLTSFTEKEIRKLLYIPQVLASVPPDEFQSLDRMTRLDEANPVRVRFSVLTKRLYRAHPPYWDVRLVNRCCEIAARFLSFKSPETEANAEDEVVENWDMTVEFIYSKVKDLVSKLMKALRNSLVSGINTLDKGQARAKKAAGATPSGEASAADKACCQEKVVVEGVEPLHEHASYSNIAKAFVDFLKSGGSAGAKAETKDDWTVAAPMSAEAFLAFLKGRAGAKVGDGVAAVSSDSSIISSSDDS